MQVLFATCYEEEQLESLCGAAGSSISIRTTSAGAVSWAASDAGEQQSATDAAAMPRTKIEVTIPTWCGKYVVTMDEFKEGEPCVLSHRRRMLLLPLIWLASFVMCTH